MAWSTTSPERRMWRGEICAIAGLIKARRHVEGEPVRCATPCAATRPRNAATGSAALVSTSEPPELRRAHQQDQAAVAAHVVERAPHLGRGAGAEAGDRPGEGVQVVHQELRRAGGAGGEQDPLGAQAARQSARSGVNCGVQLISGIFAKAPAEGGSPSATMASTSAASATKGRCSSGRSYGHSTSRRATPSSSSSASAAAS